MSRGISGETKPMSSSPTSFKERQCKKVAMSGIVTLVTAQTMRAHARRACYEPSMSERAVQLRQLLRIPATVQLTTGHFLTASHPLSHCTECGDRTHNHTIESSLVCVGSALTDLDANCVNAATSGICHVQFLLQHPSATRRLHTAACKLTELPKCAACEFGKQKRRPAPGMRSIVVRDREGALRQDHLAPGQRVLVDHFACSTMGRLC
jgi:hypothetical protein